MKTMEEMLDELTEYYECAGFADFYDRSLKDLTEDQIRELYRNTFEGLGELDEREVWEQAHLGKE